ncbi:MAG: GFA family protein [Pseudomonadota bacterium]
MVKITGSCFCGQVTYHGDVEIVGAANCHCDDCRKASGAVYLTNLFVKAEGLNFEGKTMEFHHKSDRGSDMTKVNCAACGAPIYGLNSAREGMVVLRAGTLDQKELITPSVNVFCESKVPSTPLDGTLAQFDGMPG